MYFVLFLDFILNLCPLGKFFMLFCRLLNFFQKQLFLKILSGIPSECQTVWIQIRPNETLGLIWAQSVSKGYEQTIPVSNELNAIMKNTIRWNDLDDMNLFCLFDCMS